MTAAALDTPAGRAELFRYFEPFSVLGLAVSGGPDSVAMMRLVALWRDDRLAAGLPVPDLTVLTVDHGLRPGAAEEASLVARWAAEVGFRHEPLAWRGEKPATGIQAAAREHRYRLLTTWAASQVPAAAIALAHTRDDQAETLLMRLARGSGPDGLAAMRTETSREGVALLRPLLDVSKAELLAFLGSIGAASIEDPSNSAMKFERVRIRAAGAARIALGLEDDALATTARRMARAVAALEAETTRLLRTCLGRQPLLHCGVFDWPFDLGAPDEIRIRLLGRILRMVGGTGPGTELELAAVERLAARLDQADFAGATLGRCQLVASRGRVLICREVGRAPLQFIGLSPGDHALWDGRFRVAVAPSGEAPFGREITVCGFGAALQAAVAAAAPDLAMPAIPASALAGLPAFLADDDLLAVPSVGFQADNPAGRELAFTAEFIATT